MRTFFVAVSAWVAAASVAGADSVVLDATRGAPEVSVTINGKPARMVVDGRLPDLAMLAPGATERLGVKPMPMMKAAIGLDGESVMRGAIGRPDITFANGKSRRILTGLFGANEAPEADGVIGPGALPYDEVTLKLRPEGGGAKATVIALKNADDWGWDDEIEKTPVRATFNFRQEQTLIGRRLARVLVTDQVTTPEGQVSAVPFILGVSMNAQRLSPRSALSTRAIPLGAIWGHTDDTFISPSENDGEIVVLGKKESRRPAFLMLGRSSLAGCGEIAFSRAQKTITVRCD